MCGIAGELRTDARAPSLAAVAAMNDVQAPRGPDGSGVYQQGPFAAGHRRLGILDLSRRGAQPMTDSELGLTVLFNGTVYNFRELREELREHGYRFFSTGDTEVVLKAFHRWGPACVERFNGMFAFAVYERDSGALTLARDRLGIKPLYVAETPGRLRFASTLPALLAAGDVDTEIDPVALHHYMSFHSVVPAPRTMLRGVKKLEPATVLTVNADGRREQRRYWELAFREPEVAPDDLEGWKEALLEQLGRAVRRRLVSDVPVGVLLSGGIDSSLLVGLLAGAGQERLETFSIGFESVGDEEGDEFRYSDCVVEAFGTHHHKIFIGPEETLERLPDCIAAMSEPMVSHDCIGFYLLSREVAKSIKVVQSGQGADEVFAGYHWYPPMQSSKSPVDDYARAFVDRDAAEMSETLHPRLVGEDWSRALIEAHFARSGASRPIDKALRIDQTVMLVDDPVKRVDNMTMAFGLEARVPFLDHELLEFAATVPPELKLPSGGKYLLKEAARSVIPAAVIDRPKGYFPVPALKYLQGEYLERVRGLVTSPRFRERELFQSAYVDRLLADPEKHITPLRGSKLWQIALLEAWFEARAI